MKRKKTLLLCFIHGFKGDGDTFGTFPEYLRVMTSHALPSNLDVVVEVYPKFETRGDLKECVGRLRDWLLNKVIDLEVANEAPSPTVDPSVRTVLVGHSMGGIVAAETVLEITSEQSLTGQSGAGDGGPEPFMFPYIQGVLAFDTPYLGIAPGVIAFGAEGHYNTASTALTQLSGLVGGSWGGKAAAPASSSEGSSSRPSDNAVTPKGLVGPGPSSTSSTSSSGASAAAAATASAQASGGPGDGDTGASPPWQRWGKMAMYAGAAGAVAAGGAAAYFKRDQISESWSWVGSHLEFVGCLVRGEELRTRLARVVDLKSRGLGFADMYTVLGKAAVTGGSSGGGGGGIGGIGGSSGGEKGGGGGGMAVAAVGQKRTFCSLPTSDRFKACFIPQVNDAAKDETWAHMSMFFPRDNPSYYSMAEQAKTLIVDWVLDDWSSALSSASPRADSPSSPPRSSTSPFSPHPSRTNPIDVEAAPGDGWRADVQGEELPGAAQAEDSTQQELSRVPTSGGV